MRLLSGLAMLAAMLPHLAPHVAAAQTAPTPTVSNAVTAPSTAPLPAADPWPGKKKLLIYADRTTGLHHESISHAIATVERLGRETGDWVTVIHTDSQIITKQPIIGQGARYTGRQIYARNLDFYDAIFFLGSGAGTLDAQQKADLLNFVKKDGKGFVAGHGSGVAFFDWPEFIDMLGGAMESEFPVQEMALVNEDPNFPGAAAMPNPLVYNDQFPVMRAPLSSKDVHVILRLDPAKLKADELARRPDGDMPVVWAKPYGKGRVYSLTIGHREAVWDDPKFQQLAIGAIRWALGMKDADARVGNSKVRLPAGK